MIRHRKYIYYALVNIETISLTINDSSTNQDYDYVLQYDIQSMLL